MLLKRKKKTPIERAIIQRERVIVSHEKKVQRIKQESENAVRELEAKIATNKIILEALKRGQR